MALAGAPLPAGTARWRFELGGEHVGVVELSVACRADRCAATWTSERRAPADAGGRRSVRRVEVEVDREGAFRGGRILVSGDGGEGAEPAGVDGAVPASLAEAVLAARVAAPGPRPGGAQVCVDAFDEATGARGRACARRDGDALAVDALGVAERVVPGHDGFPASVEIPSQRARFVRDGAARAPERPPRLHGTAVDGPADPAEAGSYCGASRDPDPEVDGAGLGALLPEPRAPGEGCLERTAGWLARAARSGLRGRTAVGVAWDGGRWVWHAWAEVRLERGWIPVDPSFGQLPARGPRFTLAAYEPGDEAARIAAGERILACWGREGVRPR